MDQENIVFSIILYAGNARGYAYDALKKSKEGDYPGACALLKKADAELKAAHHIQTQIIQKEADGEKTEISVLFIHAQDHLITALAEKALITEMIDLHKRVHELEAGKEDA